MKPRVSIITLGVQDLARSTSFYEQGLGFPKMAASSPTITFFELQGSWLGLFGKDSLAEDACVPPEGHGFSGFTLAHNVASKAEADQVFAQAVAAGAKPLKQPQDAFWGGYSGYFADPDGYLWEVAWNPYFWAGPADA